MADIDSKWGQQMDRIAYLVAGLVGLIVLLVPLVFSGQVNSVGLNGSVDTLLSKVKKTKEDLRNLQEPPVELAGLLRSQWEPGEATAVDPRWVTERKPVLLRKTQKGPTAECRHLPGKLLEISCQRDAQKKAVFLRVKGAMSPDNAYVLIQKVELLRKEEGGADFAPVKGFSSKGDFEFADFDVHSGKKYTYFLKSSALRDPAAPENVNALPKEQEAQQSEPLGPTPAVPYEYSLVLTNIEPVKDINDLPKAYGRFVYWDYKQGKIVEPKGPLQTFTEKDKVGDGRYEFFQVSFTDRTVIVKDYEKVGPESKEAFTLKDARTARPVDLWKEPLTSEPKVQAEEEPGETGAKVPAKKVPDKKTPQKTPEKKTTDKKSTDKKSTDKKAGSKTSKSEEGDDTTKKGTTSTKKRKFE